MPSGTTGGYQARSVPVREDGGEPDELRLPDPNPVESPERGQKLPNRERSNEVRVDTERLGYEPRDTKIGRWPRLFEVRRC